MFMKMKKVNEHGGIKSKMEE